MSTGKPWVPTYNQGIYPIDFGPFGTVLGPELQPNFNMSQGTSGWVGVGATVAAVNDAGDDAVLITSTIATTSYGEFSSPTLKLGGNYMLVIEARRGVNGTNQAIQSLSWGSIPSIPIVSTSYQEYSFEVVATAASGVTRVYSIGNSGVIGDDAYVRKVSIREIL